MKLKRISLHIGSEKTGTTRIQRLMHENRQKLNDIGILYPKCFGYTNHLDISVSCLSYEKITPARKQKGLIYPEIIEKFKNTKKSELLNECNKASAEEIIFSSEQMSSTMTSSNELINLFNLFPETEKIEIIFYIRRQDKMALSSYSTFIKSGGKHKFDPETISPSIHKYNFKKIINLWEETSKKFFVGKNIQMNIRNYENLRNLNKDIAVDFLESQKINFSTFNLANNTKVNKSLDSQSLEILRKVNHFLPSYGTTDTNAMKTRGALISYLEENSKNDPVKITHNQKKDLLTKFNSINQWVFNNYLQDDKEKF